MSNKELFRTVRHRPEYKKYRKQQKQSVVFYSIINLLVCSIGFLSKSRYPIFPADFFLVAFIISLAFFTVYTAKRPNINKGLIQEKRKSGQTYIHTIKDEYDKYLCTYRTLGESGLEENDVVFVLNESYAFKVDPKENKEDNSYEKILCSNH